MIDKYIGEPKYLHIFGKKIVKCEECGKDKEIEQKLHTILITFLEVLEINNLLKFNASLNGHNIFNEFLPKHVRWCLSD